MWLFIAFLAVPLIEIALFIQVGGAIGLFPTLVVVVITAMLGTWLVRSQGAQAMGQLRGSFNEMRDPTEPLAHGAMILFAGALLLTPGFFTDGAGFLLLFPPFRVAALKYMRSRVNVQSFTMGQHPGAQPHHRNPADDIVDGEYAEVDPDAPRVHHTSDKPSGWTQH
ncbi:FxsA family protein [Halocynthiibacter styelae]|uniref:FxsA family protein n=1 Tax=Halocynthiibacter styelae TaxID=2761955 RepID=A0A8J7IRA1_9RHOB|nr:FxsA family protein [Paenihalocynthiibacter styelae]MBI1494001.1 FxsA family protein [Paenihalocynthiibacter styelae]